MEENFRLGGLAQRDAEKWPGAMFGKFRDKGRGQRSVCLEDTEG